MFLLGLAPCATSRAQSPPPRESDGPYVNTSFEAGEALVRARKLADRGDWSAAASAYQDCIERFAGYLVGAGEGRYLTVGAAVQRALSSLPEAGLKEYRRQFEHRARAALQEARRTGGVGEFESVADRYFATSAGAEALAAAAELAAESGDLRTAARSYGRLADSHPDRDAVADAGSERKASRGRQWRTRQAVYAAWAGDLRPIRAMEKQLTAEDVAWTWTVGGRSRPMLESIRSELHAARQAVGSAEEGGGSTGGPAEFAGGPSRDNAFKEGARAEAVLWQSHGMIEGLARKADLLDEYSASDDAARRFILDGQGILRAPVFGGGLLFIHDYRTVWAIDPDRSDKATWKFSMKGDPEAAGFPSLDDVPSVLHTSSYSNGRLYIHLDPTTPSAMEATPGRASVLVCLDAPTGREIWRHDLSDQASEFEECRLDGAPLVLNSGLFVVLRKRKAFGFEACYLTRMSAETGRCEWSVHLGEAPTGSYGYRRPTLALPAAESGLVFVQTNLGTIAAVSEWTGRVAWLVRYQTETDIEQWPPNGGRAARSWHYQPPMIWGDAVVCLPLDCTSMLVLNQSDGAAVADIARADLYLPDYLIGMLGDRLYAAGTQVTAYDLKARRVAWTRPLDEGQLLGRGAVCSNAVFIPTTSALLRYAPDGGLPEAHRWLPAAAGNILPLADQVVVATADSVYGLTSRAEAIARLTQAAQEHPKDCVAPLRIASLAFDNGDVDLGMRSVDDAIERTGGLALITDESLRRRFFDDLSRFARFLASPESENRGRRLELAVTLMGFVGQCAVKIEQQVAYRMQLARLQVDRDDFPAAVETYEQILSDAGLRRAEVDLPAHCRLTEPEEAAGSPISPSAGDLARAWIGTLIAQHGREVYASIESRADERVSVAVRMRDAMRLLAVVDEFPNAKACGRALLEHARMRHDAADDRAAADSYRRAMDRVDANQKPTVIQELAECLVRARDWPSAAAWIERGARDFPSWRFGFEGRQVGFKAYGRAVIDAALVRDSSTPSANWPLDKTYQRLAPDRIAVLDPLFDALPATHWDGLLTYAAGKIERRAPMLDRAAWPRPIDCPAQPILLGMDADRFYLASPNHIFALTCGSGQKAWTVGERPKDDRDADPEWYPSWTDHALTASRLYSANDRHELIAIDLESGNVRWRIAEGPSTDGGLSADDSRVVFSRREGGRTVLVMADAATGKVTKTAALPDDRPFQAIRPAPNGLVLIVMSDLLSAVDPATGETRWSAGCADHFQISTLMVDPEGIFVSPDGRRIDKYDLADGKRLWTTPALGADRRDGLWTRISGGVLYAASSKRLAAFDTADGRQLWETKDDVDLDVQPPLLVADSMVTIGTVRDRGSTDESQAPEAMSENILERAAKSSDSGTAYRIRRYRRSDGRRRPVSTEDELRVTGVKSFGGLFARDNSLIVLDGSRLVGYSAPSR